MGKRELPLEHADALSQGLLDIGRASKTSGVSVKKIAGGHLQDLTRRIQEMQSMVTTLEHLTHNCHGRQPAGLPDPGRSGAVGLTLPSR